MKTANKGYEFFVLWEKITNGEPMTDREWERLQHLLYDEENTERLIWFLIEQIYQQYDSNWQIFSSNTVCQN